MPVIEVRQRVWVPDIPDSDLPSAEAERARAEAAEADNARLRAELERLKTQPPDAPA